MNNQYEVVFCIVNAGYSSQVMEAAKEAGVTGGTYLQARGTANKEAEQFFHISVEPEKDLVIMVVDKQIKDDVMKAIYEKAGLQTASKGVAFSMPVDSVVGISSVPLKTLIENQKEQNENNE